MSIVHDKSANARTGLAAARGVATWRETAARLLAALKAHRRARQTFNALSELDARTLKDIGIDRSEILSVSFGDNSGRRRRGYR